MMPLKHPLIIAEIGCNHNGNLEEAKSLVKKAASSNCWGVKFQFRNVATFYYSSKEIGDEILSAEISRTDLPIDNLVLLAKFAKSLNLKVGISFFRLEDYEIFGEASEHFDFFKRVKTCMFYLQCGKTYVFYLQCVKTCVFCCKNS